MSPSSDWLSYPDAPRMRTVPPGPKSREILATQAELETDAVFYPKYFPMAIREARGATVEDVDGNRYIDWVAGICVLNLGHNHPRIREAVAKQSERVWHTLEIPTETRVAFLRERVSSLPGTLRDHARVMFTVTGGDAIEAAVSLAEHVQERRGTIAFTGAYHGVHGGAVNLTGGRKYHKTSAFRGGSVIRVPFPDPYRPLLDSDGSQGTIRYLEHLLNDPYSGVDEAAAVLVEPILGEGGYVVPPDDFLPSLREFCDRHDLLLILDEVQTGLGRTGKMWACEHAKVTPDILCVAKSIGGGIPLSLVAYRSDLVRELPLGFHLGTFRANPLALAAGTEVLRLLRDEDWISRTARRGTDVLHRLRGMAESHASIGDVRGKGFMIGVEFVRDRRLKTPFGDQAKAMRRELFQNGVMMHTCGPYDQVLRFMSPLTIEDELLDRGLTVFEEALTTLEGHAGAPRPSRPVGRAVPGPSPRPGPRIPPPIHPAPTPPPPGRSLP
jgi:4-aminobutyrate aminotransferase-like enzyme